MKKAPGASLAFFVFVCLAGCSGSTGPEVPPGDVLVGDNAQLTDTPTQDQADSAQKIDLATPPDQSTSPDAHAQDTKPPNDTAQKEDNGTPDVAPPHDSAQPDTSTTACTSDDQCDDGDPCTIDTCDPFQEQCDHVPDSSKPECLPTATNSPCETGGPGSNDAAITACVCAVDSYCCANNWDNICVNVATDSCNAPCGCKAPDVDLTCSTDDDCSECNTGWDLCEGKWTCQGGQCAETGPTFCSPDDNQGCNENICQSSTGDCVLEPNNELCADDDICTSDTCDAETGQCDNSGIEGCGTNHPCNPTGTPGTKDQAINDCVCEVSSACCTEWGGWSSFCVDTAMAECGLECECAAMTNEELACTADEECGWCGDGNPCNGVWSCDAGSCATAGPVICDNSNDVGCYQNLCNIQTVSCEMTADHQTCDDSDDCTTDSCTEQGSCDNEMLCGTNHPCEAVSWPGSNDEAITACVCALDSWCCDNAWDGICVSKAQTDCNAVCDCTDPSADLSCEQDSDCSWCSENACEANWACDGGTCVAGPGLVCDTSNDLECTKNTCNPTSGTCEVASSNEHCADGNSCTVDICDTEIGICANPELEGCSGEPPFECMGNGAPSITGCAYVQSYEGCCDPWGRVLWCGTQFDDAGVEQDVTYCVDCASKNPYCGWPEIGSYYNCGTDGSAGPDEFPFQCTMP
jgi:hypothetical protein